MTLKNCYNIGGRQLTKLMGGLSGENETSSEHTFISCYYLRTSYITQAIRGREDDASFDTFFTDINQITASILNNNIESIEHEEEWLEWIDGPDGYPILDFSKIEGFPKIK